jgi:hypothetical protein
MEQDILRRAILEERLKITRKLMEIGYFPYIVKFDAAAIFEITGRLKCDGDEKLVEDYEKEINEEYPACQEPPPPDHDQAERGC